MGLDQKTTIWSCWVAGDPKPQGSKNAYVKGDKVVLVEASKGVYTWRKEIEKWARFLPPRTQFTGASWVCLDFYLTKPKTNKTLKPAQKPDIDKLTRACLDALVAAQVISDDQIITRLSVTKRWASTAGVYIVVNDDYLESDTPRVD